MSSKSSRLSEEDALSLMAEARWLKAHYESRLKVLEAENADLRTAAGAGGGAARLEADDMGHDDDLQILQAEVERMRAGEQRYLDRIEELKTIAADLKRRLGGR